MLRNYFKIAVRNLQRHKAFSFINIFGLAIGMACSILILFWVQDELNFDRFHTNADRICRVAGSLPDLGVHAAVSPAPLGPASLKELPSIINFVRLSQNRSETFQVGERIFEEKRVIFADSTFLKIFSFPLLAGDSRTALDKPENLLITESMARKYFGNEDPIGKTIRRDHRDDFTVSGVLADIPGNSHIQFDFVVPMSFLARTEDDFKNNIWDNFNYFTYLLLDEHVAITSATLDDLNSGITALYKAHEPKLKVAFNLQPLDRIHFITNLLADNAIITNINYVYILIVVGGFILLVACINFMNLATARSARRAKEVGLRKVAGAVRIQLIGQFLAESTLVAALALVIAFLIVVAAMPAFNQLSGKHLALNLLDGKFLLSLGGIAMITGILSGGYPAIFLSGFLPATVLKGKMKIGRGAGIFRNTLVIVQFVVSITLLIGTAVVFDQMKFIRERDLGFDKENLIYVPMNGKLWSKYQTFRTELDRHPLTHNFSFVEDLPTNVSNATVSVEWEGKDPNSQPLFPNMAVDENFQNVFHTTLLAGRMFSKEFRADTNNVIVNQKALQILGLTVDNAVGKPLTLWGRKGTIIGVVKDFNFRPVFQPIEPLLLRLDTWGGTAVIRTQPHQAEATIAALKKICEELNPEYPFSYDFLDKSLAKLYSSEEKLGSLFNVFSALAIFISCLGLYGLSAFLAERRSKEIGVRKVLGASATQMVYLLSLSFSRPVFIAMLIAAPLSWWAMTRWLEGFAYHVDLRWTIFLLAFLLALFIAWITIGYESIKAAAANPTDSLRSE